MGKKKTAQQIERVVMICHGSDCRKGGARKLVKTARLHLRSEGLRDGTKIVRTHCTGFCKKAPIACLQPANIWLTNTDSDDLRQAIDEGFGG